ncbi:response regulator transcription factor [Clostridium magnum]|uniref:Stage 0 sporulation protein A homolog n=1 Tax=Clostridium magnum DSM 2767 TaxID=1121326 RepID=A0A162SC43_9CLOT|nr:response regulator [Clostridium magnum]KZL91044.1 transcriptional regulatory protein YehT [Clostridium magnum DSM 2767]SHI64177.1 two-component system, response regulator YesN [Clostridium magnum DSM 2767]
MYKILLVDDESLEREALKIMLEQFKDQVTIVGEAENGREAIELDGKLDPDIIFMDIKMPGIDGIKASEIIKNRNENKAIIVLTAYDDFDLIHKALTLGVNDYILKPVKADNLLKALSVQIDSLKINKSKIKEKELLLMDKIISEEENEAETLLNSIIESYVISSNENIDYFRERIQLLLERIIKVALKFKLRQDKWINEEECFYKLKSLENIESISTYIHEILVLVFDKTIEKEIKIEESDNKKLNHLNRVLEPALKYIEENYREEMFLEKMASISNVSPYYFSKLFKKEMGMNFTTYVTKYKVEKAKEMLKNTDIPIVNIAAELGYYECGYFTKIFKKVEGVTPTKYRNKNY